MSIESVQFTEMVRRAHAALTPAPLPKGEGFVPQRYMWCDGCCAEEPHMMSAEGRDEVWKCLVCGCTRWFRTG